MIADKAKQFFDQFSTVKVLFLFDPEKNFETDVKSISGEDFEVLIDNGTVLCPQAKITLRLSADQGLAVPALRKAQSGRQFSSL